MNLAALLQRLAKAASSGILLFLFYTGFAFSADQSLEKRSQEIYDSVYNKHHFDLLDKGILTAEANWVWRVGLIMFLHQQCGFPSQAEVDQQRDDAEAGFHISHQIMAVESASIAADLQSAYGKEPKAVIEAMCRQMRN